MLQIATTQKQGTAAAQKLDMAADKKLGTDIAQELDTLQQLGAW